MFFYRHSDGKEQFDRVMAAVKAGLERSALRAHGCRKPDFPPVLLKAGPSTIGAFYDAIIAGLRAIDPPIDPDAPRF